MLNKVMVVVALMVGCGADEHGQTTDCSVDPMRCERVAVANSPSFEYGERQSSECDAIGLDGSEAPSLRAADLDGNAGCCDLHATGDVMSAWYTCVEGR